MERREFVTAVGVGSLAGVTGCIQNVVGTQMEQAEDPWQGIETSQSGPTSTTEGEASLPQGTFATRAYEPETQTGLAINYEVESGNPIDVLTMRREEFDRYSNGEDAVYLANVSTLNEATGDMRGRITAGEYVVVLDNTTWGEGTPRNDETVSFSITIGAEL